MSAAGIPQPGRGVDHRPGDVASAAEHDVGLPLAQDPPATSRRTHRSPERASLRKTRPARQPRDLESVELEARFRNEPRLDAIRRPGERHVDVALHERLRDCERRQHVAGGSPGCDQALELLLLHHVLRC